MEKELRIDLVCVEFSKGGKRYLYQAPMYSRLKAGDLVWCEGTKDMGTVVDSLGVYHEDEEYRFMLTAAGATEPLKKIVKAALAKEFKYEEE